MPQDIAATLAAARATDALVDGDADDRDAGDTGDTTLRRWRRSACRWERRDD
jgi:hypothetical protein